MKKKVNPGDKILNKSMIHKKIRKEKFNKYGEKCLEASVYYYYYHHHHHPHLNYHHLLYAGYLYLYS